MNLKKYLTATHPVVVGVDVLRVIALAATPVVAVLLLRWMAENPTFVAPVHRRLWAHPQYTLPGLLYRIFIATTLALNVAWTSRALRNFLVITLGRLFGQETKTGSDLEKQALPPWPYSRESFTVILGELQDRDGSRVPNERSPGLRPRWLTLPESTLYTGVFVTGGIGSGKTSAVAYPALRQLLGFRRFVEVRRADGGITQEEWKFSGLVLDEKGDFTRAAAGFCEEWGRSTDLIRITPGGRWIWNVIYNPNLPTWGVGYQLGWIIRNFNKGATATDPFWENVPRELVTEYLGLLDDAEGYYTLFDYLETLIDYGRQDQLHSKALARFAGDREKTEDIERRWKAITRRRDEMGVNLRGALEACAKAGIDMFRFPELRRTFCPTREEYFETDPATGMARPRPHVFTGFDQALDYGRIVGLEMPKEVYYDAAVFAQIALKSQWQDAVLRREGFGADGKLMAPPRFGERIGYCPTFLMADEAHKNATPKDADFKSVCRSKRASMWELTQSHGSIKGAFGPQRTADASTYFQNSMTRIYLRQSDLESMEVIQKECGKKLVQKTSLAVTEGGTSSELSYVQGGIIHQAIGVSSTKTVATEEKPFLELEELQGLPNNVAVVLPSNGDRTLPATITYLRPRWVFEKYPDLPITTPWLDWPEELRATYDLDSVPQEVTWKGWGLSEPLDEAGIVHAGDRLGRFVQPILTPSTSVHTSPKHADAARLEGDREPGLVQSMPVMQPEPPDPARVPVPATVVARNDGEEHELESEVVPREGNPFAELPDDDSGLER